jgi:hypothetical protein
VSQFCFVLDRKLCNTLLGLGFTLWLKTAFATCVG